LTPKKKSSKKHGWLIALWVFLLVILGAGAGAAIYYFVLPLLG
jgi:flagellar basal body-associated protein FliL